MPNTQTSVPAFTAGQVLTAAQMTEVNTGIPVFATTTTRDAAFGGTGEKTLAEGQFAYIEASNTTQYYDGAAWQTVGGGLTLVKTQTIGTAVSSVTVSDVFSSTYDNYLITASGGTMSVADESFVLKLGSNTTNYYYGAVFVNWTATPSYTAGANATAGFGLCLNGGTNTLSGMCVLQGPNLAKNTIYYSNFVRTKTDGLMGYVGGYLNDSTQYTAFTITPNSGTVTGGTIRVYGYQNS